MLSYFIDFRIGRFQGVCNGPLYLRCNRAFDLSERAAIGQFILEQPMREDLNGIAALPFLFFLFRPVVSSIDVPDVMAVKPVGVTQDKAWAVGPACFLDRSCRDLVYDPDILAINCFGLNSKRC